MNYKQPKNFIQKLRLKAHLRREKNLKKGKEKKRKECPFKMTHDYLAIFENL